MVRTPSISFSSSEKDRDKATATLSSAFASMIAVGAPYQTSRNALGMGQLRIDDGSSSHPEANDRSERKKSKRLSAFGRSGRSLSPFRFGSRKRSSSASRLKVNSDEDSEGGSRRNSVDSDTDSVVSSASGIVPRNSAFFNPYQEDDVDSVSRQSRGRPHPASINDGESSQLPASNSSTSLSSTQLADDPNAEADVESDDGGSMVSDAKSEDEEEDDEQDEMDSIVLDNTLYNAECLTAHEHWGSGPKSEDGHHHFETYEDEDLEQDDEHITAPNVVLSEDQVSTFLQRRGSKMMPLKTSHPKFERNRCTITISHGDYEAAAKNSKRPKRYVVASDGSEESSYAAEWTIGTVLRDGDEMLVVSVMETDTKLDALDPKHEEVSARMEHQRIRQAMAAVLAKQATHLLERTRLEVKISCQAIHAKNSRHMLLDLIDFYEPTMVVVGSRGLGSLRGILLGSTSHYLVQKSSAPVMVARKRLKLPALPRGKGDVVESVRARHMRLDQASIEKVTSAVEEEAKAGNKEEEDSSPDNETELELKNTQDTASAEAESGDGDVTIAPSTPPRSTKANEPGTPKDREGSPKVTLQRKGSKAAPTAIPHTSLEREAETRSQIQQRKQEAARLHTEEKKRHLFGHSDHLKTSNSASRPNSDDETESTTTTDDDNNPKAKSEYARSATHPKKKDVVL